MLDEIFTALIRGILEEAGGSLPVDQLVEDPAGELELTALHEAPRERVADAVGQATASGPLVRVGDDVVDLATAIDHVGFTHRLTAAEVAGDRLELDADLALIGRVADDGGGLHQPDASPLRLVVRLEPGAGPAGTDVRTAHLAGPAGWLTGFGPGSLVVASVADGALHLRALSADEPTPTPERAAELGAELGEELQAALTAANEGYDHPAGVDDLQAAALIGGWFEPGPDRPPFGELLAPAGLERSGDLVARPGAWAPFAPVVDQLAVVARHGDHLEGAEIDALSAALDAFRSWRTDPTATPARTALASLHRMPEAALCLEEELVRADPSGVDLAAFLDAFERPGGTVAAVLDTLRALAADLTGRAAEAEDLLDDARQAAPDWFPATEALAHLLEVRGETQEAVNLLQTTRTAQDPELQILRLRARLSSTSAGRNDPCPCGSGRKYKQCHLGQRLLPPEVQVSWLLDKARSHLDRFGPFTVTDRLPARTDLHADAALMAADLALFAHGCLERFLDARRPLLPADEVALCEAWIAGNRPGLYRVVGGDYGDRTSDAVDGETVVLVDVATDEAFVVQGTALFDQSGLADVVWCRLLPDGERWWTSGFARGVEADEVAVLAAATTAEPADLLRALLGQPVSVRVDAADGTPQVVASSSWAVGTDLDAVEAVLDEVAERHVDHWTLADDHGVALRLVVVPPVDLGRLAPEDASDVELARLAQHLVVARADSLPRHARALDLLPSWFPDAELADEHATPLARHRAESLTDELLTALYAPDADPLAPDDPAHP